MLFMHPQITTTFSVPLQAVGMLVKPQNPGPFAPTEIAFPPWLEGDWQASLQFAGYELPAKDAISRDALFAEPDVPG